MDAGSVILAILAVGLLIVFHEAGHFWAAKLSGMRVSRFSIGFGPAIAKFDRGETTYQIGLLPLGGFVQIDGMNPHDGTEPEDPHGYQSKPFHQRFATILAGPFANYLLAFILILFAFTAFHSEARPPVLVNEVVDGSPAAAGGLQPGDLIHGTRAGGAFEVVEDLKAVIAASGGDPVVFEVTRDGERLEVPVTPAREGDRYFVGVAFEGSEQVDLPPLPLGEAVTRALSRLWAATVAFVTQLASLVDIDRLRGPVGIVQDLSRSVSNSGTGALPFIANISVVLGIANLLPIPGLDGSRLLFLLVALIRRKPLAPKIEATVHAVGILLLLALLVVVSINDVLR